jgi:hypothetical protein
VFIPVDTNLPGPTMRIEGGKLRFYLIGFNVVLMLVNDGETSLFTKNMVSENGNANKVKSRLLPMMFSKVRCPLVYD